VRLNAGRSRDRPATNQSRVSAVERVYLFFMFVLFTDDGFVWDRPAAKSAQPQGRFGCLAY
jgi:hypothetical protein